MDMNEAMKAIGVAYPTGLIQWFTDPTKNFLERRTAKWKELQALQKKMETGSQNDALRWHDAWMEIINFVKEGKITICQNQVIKDVTESFHGKVVEPGTYNVVADIKTASKYICDLLSSCRGGFLSESDVIELASRTPFDKDLIKRSAEKLRQQSTIYISVGPQGTHYILKMGAA